MVVADHAELHHSKVLFIGDNIDSVLGFEKGHARDVALLRQRQRSRAAQIASNIQWRQSYSESLCNRLDYDTRAPKHFEMQLGEA